MTHVPAHVEDLLGRIEQLEREKAELVEAAQLGAVMLGSEERFHRENGARGKAEAVRGAIKSIERALSRATGAPEGQPHD